MNTRNIVMGALAIGLIALDAASCATSPTGRGQLSLVPQSQVDQMGDQAWQELVKKTPEVKDQATIAFVNQVASRVVAASPLADQKWDVKVFDSKDINAFALPGGHIGVYSGILPVAQNGAGLATVLGHEIGHVIAHHGQERMSDQLLTQGAVTAAGAALGNGALKAPLLAALGVGAQVGILLPFSRTQESEADHIGLDLMAKAGYDPRSALDFWQRMQKAASGEPPTFLSDHPATSDRIAKIKEELPQAEQAYASSPTKLGEGERAPASASGGN